MRPFRFISYIIAAEPSVTPLVSSLGPHFWANRLQDWRLYDGWVECVVRDGNLPVRTVAILTREIGPGLISGSLSAHLKKLEGGPGSGFGGFLIGAGEGRLDYRAAALVHHASDGGGGLLCVLDADGKTCFADHARSDKPFQFGGCADQTRTVEPTGQPAKQVMLRLDVAPLPNGRFLLTLSANDAAGKIASESRLEVEERRILGGMALVSSPQTGDGARFAFRDVQTEGAKIAVHDERAFGPILGAMHSLNTAAGANRAVLKLNAQFAPREKVGWQEVTLQIAAATDGTEGAPVFRDSAKAVIGSGNTALFRVENWDATRDWSYRVVFGDHVFEGTIRRDPGTAKPLIIGVIGCITPVGYRFDVGPYRSQIPGERWDGRFTPTNIYFPHNELRESVSRHNPDLLVFNGDQYYEGMPTVKDSGPNPKLDYLYKWSMFVWAFRDILRDVPCVVQVDDHDMFQGNIWGEGGRKGGRRAAKTGGYEYGPEWVNMVQRTQCAHNPDPYDPTPIEQGITVYYNTFVFGGTSFAVLEDRKWKSGPNQGDGTFPPEDGDLLGARQEKFLADWKKMHPGLPKIALSQTPWTTLQTDAQGGGIRDPDTNGNPKKARDRAVRLLREANAVHIAGDQHIPTLIRNGIETHADGPIQFVVPPGANFWLRWFEPAGAKPNAVPGLPFSGDWTDAVGNPVRVFGVGNPKIGQAIFSRVRGARNGLPDRSLKNDGYGLIRVDHAARSFSIECYPFDSTEAQFPGWPLRVPFEQAGAEQRGETRAGEKPSPK